MGLASRCPGNDPSPEALYITSHAEVRLSSCRNLQLVRCTQAGPLNIQKSTIQKATVCQSRLKIRERTLHLADLRPGRRQGLEEVGDEVLVGVREVRQVRLHRLRYLQRQDLSATGCSFPAERQLQCT